MKISEQQTIGAIAAMDYRAAGVFTKHQIDFCCKGNRSLTEVCSKENIDVYALTKELETVLSDSREPLTDYRSLSPAALADHIIARHHQYVQEKMPIILTLLEKLCSVHGKAHPELRKIQQAFKDSAGALTAHMKREELVLFPYIRKLAALRDQSSKRDKIPFFETVKNPISTMMEEHDAEGERFRQIAELSKGYTAPEDGCNTYRATYALLKEFEEDLHLHVHLENNILFPMAVELEKATTG